MTEEFSLIVNVTIVLALAGIGGLLASWLRQPPVAGYLAAGVAMGPFTPGFNANVETIATLAEVGVIFLMFALGVTFSVKELARVGKVAFWATLIQVVLTIVGGLALFGVWQGDYLDGLFIGCALAASSSMVMLKTLLDRGEAASGHGRLLLSMAIVQDLIIVLLIVLLPLFGSHAATTNNLTSLSTTLLFIILKAAAFTGVSLWVGTKAIPLLMHQVTRLKSSELFVLTAAVIAMGMATLSATLGLSAALGAFLAGLMLSESEFDHRVLSEVIPLRDLFATLFFVSVGMLIDLPWVFAHWQTVLAFAVAAILLKVFATLLGVLPFKLTPRTAAFTAIGMMPVGELNFVLAQVGLTTGHLSVDSYKLILAAALVSIISMPSLLKLAPRIGKRMAQLPVLWRCFDPNAQLSAHASALEAHAVVIGYGRVGHSITAGLCAKGMPVLVVDSRMPRVREAMADGLEALYGSATSLTVLQAASVTTARLIVVALVDYESTLAVIRQVHSLNTKAMITARAEHAADEAALREAGASLVIVPELAGAEVLLNDTLDLLGMPR